MTAQECLNFISTLLGITFGAIAIFFTWRVYKRENTINNENYIYQKKFDAYERLFSRAVEYLDKAENILVQLEQLSKNNDEYDKAEENFEMAEEILELEFQKLVFVLPEGIANIFEDLIYKKNSWKAIENIATWEKNVDFYCDQLDKLYKLITDDLHLKELNSKIFIRLNKQRKNRKLIFKSHLIR